MSSGVYTNLVKLQMSQAASGEAEADVEEVGAPVPEVPEEDEQLVLQVLRQSRASQSGAGMGRGGCFTAWRGLVAGSLGLVCVGGRGLEPHRRGLACVCTL